MRLRLTGRGYSLAEVIVVVGITALLGSLVLANGRPGARAFDVRRGAQILTSDVRRTQTLSLSAQQEENDCRGPYEVPYYGIRVRRDVSLEGYYELFADCNRDRQYNSGDFVVSSNILTNVVIQSTTPSPQGGWLEIVYIPPIPQVSIRRAQPGTYTSFTFFLCHNRDSSICMNVMGNDKGNVEVEE